jgi:hypothetical protein
LKPGNGILEDSMRKGPTSTITLVTHV